LILEKSIPVYYYNHFLKLSNFDGGSITLKLQIPF